MMIMYSLQETHTCSVSSLKNSHRIHMSLHINLIPSHPSLLLFLHSVCLADKQEIKISVFDLTRRDYNSRSIELDAGTLIHYTTTDAVILVRKDMNVKECEKISNTTPCHKLK